MLATLTLLLGVLAAAEGLQLAPPRLAAARLAPKARGTSTMRATDDGSPLEAVRTRYALTGAATEARATSTMRATDDGSPLAAVRVGYALTGAATATCWGACSVRALTYHPMLQLPAVHNILTTAGAFSALPLFLSVFAALWSASGAGWKRLRSPTYRRLNLGLAAASAWCAVCAAGASYLSAGRTSYPPLLLAATLATHLLTALHCVRVWALSLGGGGPPSAVRVIQGALGALWRLAPAERSDDPGDARCTDGRNEYAALSLAFALFAALSVAAPFPLATVPSFLGRRLSRAYGGWLLLASVMMYSCKDAAERGRLSTSTFCTLKRGMAASSAFHLAVTAAKLIFDDLDYYANALVVKPASVASLAVYALALVVCTAKPGTREPSAA